MHFGTMAVNDCILDAEPIGIVLQFLLFLKCKICYGEVIIINRTLWFADPTYIQL